MTLNLLHPLLAGLAAAAVIVPILIHLLLRQRPKTVLFPAMMLLRKREVQTIRRLRLQHWLLLILRCALLLLLGLALARPTLRSAGLSIDQEAPIAAVMIIDNSPSMSYTERGTTRLDRAKQVATDAANRLPEGSQIAVLSTSESAIHTLATLAAARQQIEGTEPAFERGSLADALAAGLEILATSELERREVYLFSDVLRHGWNLSADSRLADLVEKGGDNTNYYVINVRAETSDNLSIESARLSSAIVSPDSEVEIESVVRSTGAAADNIVRLTVDGEARGEKPVRVPAGQAVSVKFPLSGLAEGFHQGEVRLATSDAMPADDVRYFAIDVRSPPRVLIVTDDASESLYFRKALEPARSLAQGESPIVEISSADWMRTDVSSFGVIAMLNVAQLDPPGWSKLADFVSQGGGVFIALGARCLADSYNTAPAQETMPVKIDIVHDRPPTRLAVGDKPHPLVARFNAWGQSDLADGAVLRYWRVSPTKVATLTIMNYADGQPALIERSTTTTRSGRVLLLTTPTHYQAKEIWNELPLSWSFVVLAEEIVHYLSGSSDIRLDFEAGQSVEIPRRPSDPFTLYAVSDPAGIVERIAVDNRDLQVVIPQVRTAGPYAVSASAPPRQWASGFCVNISPSESQLEPIPDEEVLASLPQNRSSIVRDSADLKRIEGTSRIGRELFPWLMLMVVAALFAEAYLSNRFYRRSPATSAS